MQEWEKEPRRRWASNAALRFRLGWNVHALKTSFPQDALYLAPDAEIVIVELLVRRSRFRYRFFPCAVETVFLQGGRKYTSITSYH